MSEDKVSHPGCLRRVPAPGELTLDIGGAVCLAPTGVLRGPSESSAATPAPREVGLLVCQAGEFAFVIFGIAREVGVFSAQEAKLLLTVTSVSMACTPLLSRPLGGVHPASRAYPGLINHRNPFILSPSSRDLSVAILALKRAGGFLESHPLSLGVSRSSLCGESHRPVVRA